MGGWLKPFSDASYAPHGYCLLWDPTLVWTHVIADALIAVSYFSIALALFSLMRRRRDIRYGWMIRLFATFILACGATHAMSIWTLRHGNYGAEAMLKALTAAASVATAIMLWPLIPKAVALPSTASLAAANAERAEAITSRDAAMNEMRTHMAQREQAERAPPHETKPEAEVDAETALTGLNILVIDDDPDVLHTVAAIIEARGATTVIVEDGRAGLAAAGLGGIDMAIVDFAMPRQDGAEVAARLRKAHPERPVLIVTGFSESASWMRCSNGTWPCYASRFPARRWFARSANCYRGSTRVEFDRVES